MAGWASPCPWTTAALAWASAEAAIMMHAVGRGGGGYAAASSIHLNIFGPHAIVVHGSEEQKARFLPPLIKGEQKACFGVTEPNAGLDTTSHRNLRAAHQRRLYRTGRKSGRPARKADKILLLTRTATKLDGKRPTDGMTLFYTDLDRTKVEVRRIPKMGRAAVDSNAVFIDDLHRPRRRSHRRGRKRFPLSAGQP